MKKIIFLILFFTFNLFSSTPKILSIEFSTDGGKTYTNDFPVIEGAKEVFVKVSWEIPAEIKEDIKDGVVLTILYSEQTDFASANRGYHTKNEGWITNGWFQRLPKYYFGLSEKSCIYAIDLRERKEGTLGDENKWDKDQKKWINAPLPYCPPLKEGTYKFTVSVYYYTKDNKRIINNEDFFITISKKKKEIENGKETKINQQKSDIVQKVCSYFDIREDYIFSIDEIKIIEGKGDIKKDGKFVITQSEQEIGWNISNIKEGDYYILLITQTGIQTGEEEILRDSPFIFLNGKGVIFDKCGPLFSYKNIYYSIIQSKRPYYIKNGDEIRINSIRKNILIGNLILKKEKIEGLPLFVREPYNLDDFIRIDGKFEGISFENKKGNFFFSLKNVKGRKEKYKYQLKILDFQQRKILEKNEDIELINREKYEKNFEFQLTDTDRYRAILICYDQDGNKIEKQFEILVDNPFSFRKKIWLNKDWEYFSIKDDGTLKTRKIKKDMLKGDEKWKRVDLPASWKDLPGETGHICWYRKKFFVPEWFKNERYFIHFSRINCECEVYLNGEKIGEHFGYGPFEIEITKYLKVNENNEILLGVRDEIACLVEDELSKPNIEVDYSSKLKSPLFSKKAGVGEVYIYSTKDLKIEDIFIKTFYREKKIILEIQLPEIRKEGLVLKNKIYSEGKQVFEFDEYKIKKDESKIKLEKKWSNPILWGPKEFPLLVLKTELFYGERIIDMIETRFGFREFWPEGKHLYWNGVKLKLPSLAFLSTWGWDLTNRSKREFIRNEYMMLSKKFGVKMHRHIYDPEYRAEIADEEGIIFAQGTATIAGPTDHILDSDEFWENKIRTDKEIINGLKNHPSVVTWYVSNEFMGYSNQKNYERLKRVYEELIKVDDTRIIEFGCDIDLRGVTNIFSTHYPVDVYALRYPTTFLPNLVYWRDIDKSFEKGMQIPSGQVKKVANVIEGSPMRYGEKPIIINECCWNVHFNPPDGFTRLIGEEVYVNPASVEIGHKETNKWFVYGHRDVESSVITLWEWIYRNPILLEIPEVDINIIQKYNKFFEGEYVSYDVNLHYDRFEDKKLEFKWKLENEKGEMIKGDNKYLSFSSCDLIREKVTFLLPKVKQKEKFFLKLYLLDGNYPLVKKEVTIFTYPKSSISIKTKHNIALYDPENTTFTNLTKLISNIENIDRISPEILKKFDILIIGEKQKEIKDEAKENILKWVKDGGKVLILKQNKNLNLSPMPLIPSSLNSSTSLTFRNSHPLFKKINIDELNYWYPEHKIGENFYIKPQSGNYKCLVEAGGPEGYIYVGMIEIPYGDGLLFFNQLNLLENFEKNPICKIILQEIIEYLGSYKENIQKCGVILGQTTEFLRGLMNIGVKFDIIKNLDEIYNYKVILIDEKYIPKADEIEKLNLYLRKGGMLFFNKVTYENCGYISKIVEDEIKITKVLPESFVGRAIKMGRNKIIEGLTNYDFFWKRRPESENYGIIFSAKEYNLGQISDYEILSQKGDYLFYPSYILNLKVGKGEAILNNINWEGGHKPHSTRIISTILTNIGVKIEKEKEEEIPKNLNYKMIDISNFLNRSFKDEKKDDGIGGWTDQGPDCDLSDFPLDKNIFISDGVPFRIEKPLSCIVLSSKYRPQSNLPEKIEIPINSKFDFLFFLQSSAWTSKDHHGSYIINYEDGTNYEIKLVGGVNLRDWASSNPEEPFLYETDTFTKCAWKGKSGVFPIVSIYKMGWRNPFPEKEIKSIIFSSKKIGVPILIAITGGNRPDKIEK
ncbi:MAG: hypothetical protein NC833_00840 [Candidatus Omnitrophica bacterium]|nr:hypothetical protein [Candidatus Omnitrophota bacterium]